MNMDLWGRFLNYFTCSPSSRFHSQLISRMKSHGICGQLPTIFTRVFLHHNQYPIYIHQASGTYCCAIKLKIVFHIVHFIDRYLMCTLNKFALIAYPSYNDDIRFSASCLIWDFKLTGNLR